MVAKVIGALLIAWGILMTALAIVNLVLLILAGGDWSGIPCAGGYLLIGLGATYAGRQLYHRESKNQKKPDARPGSPDPSC